MTHPVKPETIWLKRQLQSSADIRGAILAEEARLSTLKWFDYRFMTPDRATSEFIRCYIDVFKRKMREEVDVEQAKNAKGIDQMKYRIPGRPKTLIWKARQRADEAGMPYGLYIEESFNFALKRKRLWLPQPNQLHHPGKANEYWLKHLQTKWIEHTEAGLVKATHLAYRIENFADLPAQRDYREYVLDLARAPGPQLNHFIQVYSLNLQQVPAEDFATLVSPERFEQELYLAQSNFAMTAPNTDASQPASKTDLWPSCFGLIGAQDHGSSVCQECSMSPACASVTSALLRKREKVYGTADPAHEKKKAADRERQRRKRERDRAALTVTP